jgi:endo-1,4-beta-xylanase
MQAGALYGFVALIGFAAAADAVPDPAAPCAAAKLDASGRAITRRIQCEVGRQGRVARRICRRRADRRLRRAFDDAQRMGGCLAVGSDAAVAAVRSFVGDTWSTLRRDGRRSPCARGALVAAGNRATTLLLATADDLVDQDTAVFLATRAAAETRFQVEMDAAFARGGCAPAATSEAVAAASDAVAEAVRVAVLPPLRALAAPTGRRIGAAVQSAYVANERDYRETLAREFDAITAEFEALWIVLHPAQGVYAFDAMDALADFAAAHGMLLRAHHLIWDLYYADYLNDLTAEALRDEFEEHIRTVAGRYRGKVASWVVVNEAANLVGEGYRPGLWVDTFGPGYIADAFRIAHEADPDAQLFYNDVFMEEIGEKSDFVYAMVQDLLAQGVPIDGVGFQMHHFFGGPIPATLQANLQRFADLGLRVQLTEMDVLSNQYPGDLAERLLQQGAVYHDAVAACLAVDGCDAVTFWGFTDKHSWIDLFVGPNRHPLPFDADYRPKPAYLGVREALRGR